jgi:hypothetical protein
MVTAHLILGNLSGATQQSLANRSLTLAVLPEEAWEVSVLALNYVDSLFLNSLLIGPGSRPTEQINTKIQ